MKVPSADRPKTGAVYAKYRSPFLEMLSGAESKELLLRDEDVQFVCFLWLVGIIVVTCAGPSLIPLS